MSITEVFFESLYLMNERKIYKQNTLTRETSFSGIALHTGARSHLRLLPSQPDSGIVFKRVDTVGKPEVAALVKNVTDVRRGTTISSNGATVCTVEHVLASLHAAEVDNAVIEMDGPEPPIGDGSAAPYVKMIQSAGLTVQDADAKIWTATSPITLEEGGTKITLLPCDELKITCEISFGDSPLDQQSLSCQVTPEFFASEIAGARTFCLYKELEQLIAMGLVKGGSLDNAIIIHNGAIICKEELRYKDELVRHKILDIIGDVFLSGARVKAHIIAKKPGHPSNVLLVKKMIQQQEGL
jgi:UDP-3-O-acyl N-acetylglucosamine deacetylase